MLVFVNCIGDLEYIYIYNFRYDICDQHMLLNVNFVESVNSFIFGFGNLSPGNQGFVVNTFMGRAN